MTVSQFAAAGRFWLVRGSIKENGDGRPVNTANVNNWIQVLKDNPTISFVING